MLGRLRVDACSPMPPAAAAPAAGSANDCVLAEAVSDAWSGPPAGTGLATSPAMVSPPESTAKLKRAPASRCSRRSSSRTWNACNSKGPDDFEWQAFIRMAMTNAVNEVFL